MSEDEILEVLEDGEIAPKSPLEEILEWSQGKHNWWRDAIRRILQNGNLTDLDIVALCGFLGRYRPNASREFIFEMETMPRWTLVWESVRQ